MFDTRVIEKFQSIKTPFYYYDLALLEENLRELKKISSEYDYQIHYALKANVNGPILDSISGYGLGADCVSGNEIKRALEYKFPRQKIVFAGVGKTDKELKLALRNDIQCINCESLQELEVINQLAQQYRYRARVALRINPDLEANTHRYITTGRKHNKFGIAFEEVVNIPKILVNYSNIQVVGLHAHIGSQITDLNVFRQLALRLNDIQDWFKQKRIIFNDLNLGGGLGVDYQNPDQNPIPDYQRYFQMFKQNLQTTTGQQIHFELGRAIVAQCGSLISRVLYVKGTGEDKFVVLDAGMTELIRPALYSAYHKIENLTGNGAPHTYNVVGPVCESSDFLGKKVELPETKRGDLLAIRTTGAYAQVMASRYNLRNFAKAVYSNFY
jgi:diaminopimelate decarboxylase